MVALEAVAVALGAEEVALGDVVGAEVAVASEVDGEAAEEAGRCNCNLSCSFVLQSPLSRDRRAYKRTCES